MIVGIVVWALAAFCVALFAARGWSRGSPGLPGPVDSSSAPGSMRSSR